MHVGPSGWGRGFGLRRVQVVLAGLGHVVIHADVAGGSGGDRAGTPGPGGKISPLGAVASLGGVHHAALHGGVHRCCCPSAAGEFAGHPVRQLRRVNCGAFVIDLVIS